MIVKKYILSDDPRMRVNGIRWIWTEIWGTSILVVRSVMINCRWQRASLGQRGLCQVNTVSGLSALEVTVRESSGGSGSEKL